MKVGYKILIGVLITGGLITGYCLLNNKKKAELPPDDKKPDVTPETKNPVSSNVSGNDSVKEKEVELVIEEPKTIVKATNGNVVSVCSTKVYKTLLDDKGVPSLGSVIASVKGNTRIGEFVKNVFIHSTYVYVIVKTDAGNEVLVNKTHTKIEK